MTSGYAMSETPYGTVWPRGTRPYATIGSPRQHPTLGEVNEARVNADGELELRNPAVMKGYWGMPEETAAVLAPDGWLKTGDLVTREPRRHVHLRRVAGRRSSGAAARTWRPRRSRRRSRRTRTWWRQRWWECPRSSPRRRSRPSSSCATARSRTSRGCGEWAAERLTKFKVPEHFEALDELPHTATGRVAKHRLPR